VGKCFKSHGDERDISLGGIEITNLVIIAGRVSTGVGILLLSHYAKHGGVGESQWLNGSHAATSTSTVKRVGCAAGDMLGGEGDQVVGHVVDLAIGRHGSCRGECPA